MRILVISNLYPPHYVGGYELRCRDITEALHQRGHQVSVLTSDHHVASAKEDAKAEYPIQRTLKLHGFFGHPWLGIRKLEGLERHNNAELLAAIETFKPDVVHVWNLGGISKSLTLTLQRLNIPTVYDVSDHWIARSLVADVWLDWWNRAQTSKATQMVRSLLTKLGKRHRMRTKAPTNPVRHIRFQRVYFCSRRLREIAVEAGYTVEHGDVIHCPVNTESYHGEVKPAHLPLKKLLYAGRISDDKGIFTALQALRAIKGLFDGELHVYGKGEPEYEDLLKGYVAYNNLPVTFHSATPDQMPEVYRNHDALLFTSEWEEPFALTPLEAMASGLPVIGTLTGGSAELFQHGKNALTYQAGDPQQLANNILKLAEQPVLREHIARAGQEQVREQFKLPSIVTQIENYLEASLRLWQPVELPHHDAA